MLVLYYYFIINIIKLMYITFELHNQNLPEFLNLIIKREAIDTIYDGLSRDNLDSLTLKMMF